MLCVCWTSASGLTVKEAVVFEAAAAEERMERVQTLFSLHGLGEGAVHVGGAERRKLHRTRRLQQVFIPDRKSDTNNLALIFF